MSAYAILQRLWRDNQQEIDQHNKGELSERMRGYVDGLCTNNSRILAAMAGLDRPGEVVMSKEQIEAWINRHQPEAPVREESSSIWPSGASTAPELIEGSVVLPIRADDDRPDAALR